MSTNNFGGGNNPKAPQGKPNLNNRPTQPQTPGSSQQHQATGQQTNRPATPSWGGGDMRNKDKRDKK